MEGGQEHPQPPLPVDRDERIRIRRTQLEELLESHNGYQEFFRRWFQSQWPSEYNRIEEDNPAALKITDKYTARPVMPRDTEYEDMKAHTLMEKAVYASSCDDDETQGAEQMLDFTASPATFWSSAGFVEPNVCQSLVFRLRKPNVIINKVAIKIYRAHYQPGQPIYPAQYVRFGVGHSPQNVTFSNNYRMLRMSTPQVFDLEKEKLGMGSYLVVVLTGMLQTQISDDLFYVALENISCTGYEVPEMYAIQAVENMATHPWRNSGMSHNVVEQLHKMYPDVMQSMESQHDEEKSMKH